MLQLVSHLLDAGHGGTALLVISSPEISVLKRRRLELLHIELLLLLKAADSAPVSVEVRIYMPNAVVDAHHQSIHLLLSSCQLLVVKEPGPPCYFLVKFVKLACLLHLLVL